MSDQLTLKQASRQSGIDMPGILAAIRSGELETVVTADGRRLISSDSLHVLLHPITGKTTLHALKSEPARAGSASTPKSVDADEARGPVVAVGAQPSDSPVEAPASSHQDEPVQVLAAAEFEARSHPVAVHGEQVVEQMKQLVGWCEASAKQLQALDKQLFEMSQKLLWQEIKQPKR